MNLAAFLLDRIAEDEAVARAVSAEDWAESWRGINPRRLEIVRHIARHDPARVLADCDAKRRIVERLSGYLSSEHDPEPEGAWELLDDHAWATLYALALPFADHPDYDPSWRP
jgi:hypothetical protein